MSLNEGQVETTVKVLAWNNGQERYKKANPLHEQDSKNGHYIKTPK